MAAGTSWDLATARSSPGRSWAAPIPRWWPATCEVDLAELEAILALGVDAVLLDNMSPDQLRRAVELVAGRAITEASGGITPESAVEVAATGVDVLSLGWLTHSVPVLDAGLDVERRATRPQAG